MNSFDSAAVKKYLLELQDLIVASLEQNVHMFVATSDSYREILGVRMGDTESFATWNEIFRWLICRSTNEEVRIREWAILIFPNDKSALHLIGTLLAEYNEIWQEQKYLDMDKFRDWVASRNLPADGGKVIAING